MSMERYQREKDMKDLQDLGLRDGLNRNYLMKKNRDYTSKVKEVGQQMEKWEQEKAVCQTYLLFSTVYSTLWQLSAGILASSVATMHEVKQLKKKQTKPENVVC